jgi:hypothetical protein
LRGQVLGWRYDVYAQWAAMSEPNGRRHHAVSYEELLFAADGGQSIAAG